MNNLQIRQALDKQFTELYDALSTTTLSALFKQEYAYGMDGSVVYLDDGNRSALEELEQLANDTSHDNSFDEKVRLVK